MNFAAELPCVTSVRADPSFRPGRPGAVRWIVIHTAECGETATAGAAVAGYLVATSSASAHFVVSDRETIQQVRLRDTAWAAPGANELGIQIEMVGRANQTAEQWADAYSTAMLERVAVLVASLCAELGIPARMVDADGLRRGDLGITTHAAVTRAWRRSTHFDPGPNWPGDAFIAAVEARLVV